MQQRKQTAAKPALLLPQFSGPFQADRPPLTMVVKLLSELGPNLPVGILAGGLRSKPFRLRPFRLKEEKELGLIRDKGKGLTFGEFVSAVLCKMVQTVGPHSFDALDDQERRLVVSQMLMADVLYLYLYLRYDALGAEEPVALNVTCPSCRHSYQFDAELGSLEVRTLGPDALDLRRLFQLRDGLQAQGELRTKLHLHPLLWGTMERKDFVTASSGQKEAITISGSIVGAEDVGPAPFIVTEPELEELTKYDVEGIIRDIEDNSPGPIMTVELECPACRRQQFQMLDWSYDSFFARSSQLRRGRA